MDPRQVEHGSPDYWRTVDLRTEILRKPLGLVFTPEQLAAESSDIHLAIFAEQKAIACLILTRADRAMQMRQVAVAAAEQGKGIGRILVEFSEKIAQREGFHQMILHARDTAIPFYTKLGYLPSGDPFEEVGIPHQLMTKSLI